MVPSFFLTNTTEDAKELELGLMWLMSNNSLMAFSISSLNFLAPSSSSMICSKPLSGGYPGATVQKISHACEVFLYVWRIVLLMFYAIIIVLCISIDKSNIRTRSLRNTHSQETQHLSWETL
jgi:hypothetical protein